MHGKREGGSRRAPKICKSSQNRVRAKRVLITSIANSGIQNKIKHKEQLELFLAFITLFETPPPLPTAKATAQFHGGSKIFLLSLYTPQTSVQCGIASFHRGSKKGMSSVERETDPLQKSTMVQAPNQQLRRNSGHPIFW